MQLARDSHAFARLPPAMLALAAQVVAAVLLWVLPLHLESWSWVLMQGGVAAWLSYALRLAPWWWVIQLIFAPAAWLAASWQLPSSWFMAGFVVLALVYWGAFRSQVPLYFSSTGARQQLARLLPQQCAFTCADLGCGVGSMLSGLAALRSDGRFVGIESAPLPFLASWVRAALGQGNCEVRWGDFWQHDLAPYDVVYAYLSPVPMAQLWDKARREMRPGSLLVSNTFLIPGVPPDCSIPFGGGGRDALHVWRMQGLQP